MAHLGELSLSNLYATKPFESGSRKPSLENFYKLIVVLNVAADYILGRSENMSNSAVDQITNALQNLPYTERNMIEKFIISLANDQAN